MIRLRAIAGLTGLAAIFWIPATAAAEEPLRLPPSSTWHLDYAEDSCRLARRFGEGDRSILLAMDRFEPGDQFRLTLIGRPLRRARAGRDATLRFGPAELEQSEEFLEATTGDRPTMIFRRELRIAPLTESERQRMRTLEERGEFHLFELPPVDPSRERAVEYLQVEAPGISPIVLETGSLGVAFDGFRQCIDELLTHWGIDVEKHRSRTRKAFPTRPLASLISYWDYPDRALARREQAMVHFRLIVDAQGGVSGCHVQRATQGDEAFRQAVCDTFTRRARFEPALDAEGNPMASYYVGTVHFRIEQ